VDDPGVRSVRVAVALCDRFAELLKGPSTVSAHKQEGALLGVSGNQDALSLRIGEAQQIYPEIWGHLDDARTAFAGRGIDVGDYDVLRAAEGNLGLGAAVDVKYTTEGFGQHAVHHQVKAANFNQAGLHRARLAYQALMRATPLIDWAAIAAAEANDPAAAAFGRSTRMKRWLSLGVLALVVGSPFLYVLYTRHRDRVEREERRDAWEAEQKRLAAPPPPLSAAEVTQLKTMVEKQRAQLTGARQSWATAVAPDRLAALTASSAPCPFTFEPPPSADADRYIHEGTADPSRFGTDFIALRAGSAFPDQELERDERIVEGVSGRVAAGHANAGDHEMLKNIDPYIPFVFIDKDTPADITATAPKMTYTPGQVTGRGYVFSIPDGRVVCAATIDVKNPPSDPPPAFLDGIRRAPDAKLALHRELEVRLRQAMATGLHATQP
ncbi:MAG TPA: hypothetical protein VLB44_14375, partial [Kofleriaceae bacterium]|nr:hypothetical protein [Kofleriaceae bacterium]